MLGIRRGFSRITLILIGLSQKKHLIVQYVVLYL